MSQHLFPRAGFWSALLQLDHRCADDVRQRGCPHCGGRLHSARYARKPRGIDRSLLGEAYLSRESFCCADCRRRTTPPSLRFLGRKVYLGALLVLFGNAGGHPAPTPSVYRSAAATTGIPARTLERWHRWWTAMVPFTRWWRELGPRFLPPVDCTTLPGALLARIAGVDATTRLTRVLALASPLTTRTCSHFARVALYPHKMA